MSYKLPHVEVHEAMCKFIGDMAKENEALKERIKRLEEAGDALSETQTYDLIQNINWRKAKEAKP